MKQIPMTPELSALIKKSVGEDVETDKLVVFETIALNTHPLPGKDGTLFEKARVKPVTLSQMVDYINAPNSLPLMADHELFGAPKGKVFYAGLHMEPDEGLDSLEMRELFFLDETEEDTIKKLNSGSLDEVSVAFLSSALLCSECGWDYFGPDATPENVEKRTCANGHEIGEEGVHLELEGLNTFFETSLVARGAAKNPKIVGKSQSKLAPANTYRLAAKGFETDALIVYASMGKEEDKMDATVVTNLTAQVATLTGEREVAKAENTRLTAALETANTELTAERTKVTQLETQLTEAKEAKPEDYETSKAEAGEAITFLQEQVNHLRVAKGETKLEGDKLPSKVAELKAMISELTGNLTSILPVGGRSTAAGGEDNKTTLSAVGFKTRN